MGIAVKKPLEKLGGGESWIKFRNEEEIPKIWENLEREARIKLDKGLWINWGRVERSSYSREYNRWKKEIGCEKYLIDRKTDSKTKEQ